jgi:Glycogen recognition site of AMP-activated protein kinase
MSLIYSSLLNETATMAAANNVGQNETTSPLYFHIKRIMKNSKPVTERALPVHPRLFQIAARLETFSATQIVKSPRTPRGPAQKNVNSNKRGYSSTELKWTEFKLAVPHANCVKLAAEFTDWEKFPLDMIRSETGVWSITVPLAPGNYSYRFIVDDEWLTDSSTASAASSFEDEEVNETTMNVA